MSIGRQDYAERKESKIDALKERARKTSELANQEFERARNMGSVIPLGQPILVGHHSEGKHRALLKKIDNTYRRASEAYDKSEYYVNRAETAETNIAISGDDPEAATRYQAKLEELEKKQEYMKAVNKAWKQGKTALIELGFSEAKSEALVSEKRKPCPTWQLSNNNAEIRRVKEKLETLKKLDSMEADTIVFNGGEMRINIEINRVQFIFDDIPSEEIRKRLKSHGFKWSPTQRAWQRQRTLNAIRTAKNLIEVNFYL
jgi:prefoldin subunit 5